jgi:hypothetical protein
MTKIVRFTKNDLIGGIVYNTGDIAGFEARIADNLIKREYAVLHGNGHPVEVGKKLPPAFGEFGYEAKGGKAA